MLSIKKIYKLETQTPEELKDNNFYIGEVQPYTKKEAKIIGIITLKYGEMLTVKELAKILGYADSTIYNHGYRLPRCQIGGNRMLYYIDSVIIMTRYREKGVSIVALRKLKSTMRKLISDPDKK